MFVGDNPARVIATTYLLRLADIFRAGRCAQVDCCDFEVMRLVILAQDIVVKRKIAADASAPDASLYGNAETPIEVATLGGARTLFLDDRTGSLEVGKAADWIILGWDQPALTPGWVRRRSTIRDDEEVVREAKAIVSAAARAAELDALLPARKAGSTSRGWTDV